MPGIGVIEYVKKDIVRHPLVQRIVDAYEAEPHAPEAPEGDADANDHNDRTDI